VLQAAEKFVEFVGGFEIGFEFSRGQALAKIVQAAREEVERGRENFLIGKNDVPPGRVGAAGEAERIAQPGTRERDGEAVLVESVVEKPCERYGRELRQMRDNPTA
jgi:hypothetical protein